MKGKFNVSSPAISSSPFITPAEDGISLRLKNRKWGLRASDVTSADVVVDLTVQSLREKNPVN